MEIMKFKRLGSKSGSMPPISLANSISFPFHTLIPLAIHYYTFGSSSVAIKNPKIAFKEHLLFTRKQTYRTPCPENIVTNSTKTGHRPKLINVRLM